MPKRTLSENVERPKRKAAKAGSAPRIASNGHRLPDPLPPGAVLTDVTRKQWRLGRAVGLGGFGEIYLASDQVSKPVPQDAPYVVKIEPHSNGPLFAEMHFYYRVGKEERIGEWVRKHRLDYLGMPRFLGSGSHDHSGSRYRFMVMERLGEDLQKVLNRCGRKFPLKTIYTLGIRVIQILEYIHSFGYIHADVKASNLLLGYGKGNEDKVYLVDFGLACRYRSDDGTHKEYKEDLRKAHDGTIEFTSRDAHIGAHSRRGDLEILGYNMLQWLSGKLPWEDNLKDPECVSRQKARFMDDLPALMKSCFHGKPAPSGLVAYFQYVADMEFDEEPNYKQLRKILVDGIRAAGHTNDWRLEFPAASPRKSPKGAKKGRVPANSVDAEPDEAAVPVPKRAERSRAREPLGACPAGSVRQHGAANRKASSASSGGRKGSTRGSSEASTNGYAGGLDNPTPAMLQVLQRRQELLAQQEAPCGTSNWAPKGKRSSVSPPAPFRNGQLVCMRDQKIQTVGSRARPAKRPLCSTASQTSSVDSDSESGGCSPEI